MVVKGNWNKMLFNSLHFLLFFPLVTLIYFVIPQRVRYLWLLAASYYFYMCWNAKYALLIATSTLITYASGLLIQKAGSRRALAKTWVAISFGSNLAILFFFKYFDFAVESLARAFSLVHIQLNVPTFDILLPVGISFYTFQALSYTMDVYRAEIKAERNLLKYALFVSFFPQLVAGPIERSKNLLTQIHQKHTFCYDRMKSGLLLMLWGFFEKLIVADRAAIFVNSVYERYRAFGTVELVLASVLFAVQIYCDFGGYSHIAVGAARVMGFQLMDNFRQPYFARSIKDFWRRWHISLSTWFRDYLYIPLGGSHCKRLRHHFNVMVTFLVSGLWHGASWSYVAWGGLHGVYQVIGQETQALRKKMQKKLGCRVDTFGWRFFQTIGTFVLVDIAWIFFRAPGCAVAIQILVQIFTRFNPWVISDGSLLFHGLSGIELFILFCGILVLLAVDFLREKGVLLGQILQQQPLLFRWGVYLGGLLVIVVFGVYGQTYDASQFIYFQF